MPSYTRYLGILGLCATIGCVEGPLERSNILDEGAKGQIILTGIPDTVFSRNESFEIFASFTKDLPKGIAGATFTIVEGADYLYSQGGNRMGASGFTTVVPVRARIRAFVYNARHSPITEKVVWLRQKPVSLELACFGSTAAVCGLAMPVGGLLTVPFAMLDATNIPVVLPEGAFRWGTAVSRSPTVVEVASRESPSIIVLRGLSAGFAWVVLSGEGLRDSVQVQVIPPAP